MNENITSPIKAIRAKCLECGESSAEVKVCPVSDCPLFPFRFGKNPYHKRTISPENLEKMREALRKSRETK